MDVYDREIEKLIHGDMLDLRDSWGECSPLFQFCKPKESEPSLCGCLTMVRGGRYVAANKDGSTSEATLAIRADESIPATEDAVAVDLFIDWDEMAIHERRALLTRFAVWQRALDATIRQGKPWHPEFAPSKTVHAAGVESVRKEETDACKPEVAQVR